MTANEQAAWEPRTWTDARYPAPYVPVLNGMRVDQYRDALPSFGEDESGTPTRGAGYGDRISVVHDPATGALGVVTKWEWNSPVRWYLWTPKSLEIKPRTDVHSWMWDTVQTMRHLLTCYAFQVAAQGGQLVGYWDTAPHRETAEAANRAHWEK